MNKTILYSPNSVFKATFIDSFTTSIVYTICLFFMLFINKDSINNNFFLTTFFILLFGCFSFFIFYFINFFKYILLNLIFQKIFILKNNLFNFLIGLFFCFLHVGFIFLLISIFPSTNISLTNYLNHSFSWSSFFIGSIFGYITYINYLYINPQSSTSLFQQAYIEESKKSIPNDITFF